MPRTARIKTYNSIFHIMCRSISEIDLFKDENDKTRYLTIIKKYQMIYIFKVYGYCLMDNHVHLIIDANGSDISKVMHSINFSYAQYFNRIHERHGHLFQDRFKSKIIKDERYLLTLSAYIHNNAVDISAYRTCPQNYPFSSLGIYLGLWKDKFKLVDESFVMSFFGKNSKETKNHYISLVLKCNDKEFKDNLEFEDEVTEYKGERVLLIRNYKEEDIINFISSKLNISKISLCMKYSRSLVYARALLVILMRSLCNFSCSNICRLLGNITQARVSKLSSTGVSLLEKDDNFKYLVEEFIHQYAA